tara:strand:+ start:359 stop:571 length:213 start_codon:yes stop_codon:yes gene_type:complete
MGFEMKPGDLVQSNIFDKEGSGAYGMVVKPYEDMPGYWNVQWCSDEWELTYGIVGIYEISEKDLVVVSEA